MTITTKFNTGDTAFSLVNNQLVGVDVERIYIIVSDKPTTPSFSTTIGYDVAIRYHDICRAGTPRLSNVAESQLFSSPQELADKLVAQCSRP